jgi:hypothetical protein
MLIKAYINNVHENIYINTTYSKKIAVMLNCRITAVPRILFGMNRGKCKRVEIQIP